MADNLTKIGSGYDMIDIMQQIGSNYFDNDISTQRIGMFGFTVESLANMFGAAILDASNRQREYNVYTAQKRSTLLYEGSKLDVNIDNARPSKMTAYLGILTSSLINTHSKGGYGTPDPNSADPNHPDYKLVIEKDMVINIADYDFMVENDIMIKANYSKNTNSYTYSVQYLFEGDKDSTSNIEYTIPRYETSYKSNDKYIQSYLHTYNKDLQMLLFKVELVQITKETKYQTIIKNDIISLTGLDFNYSNNLSHFNIFYRKNNTSEWENIMKVPIYNSDENYEEDVIFYEVFHDEKKIRLNITDFNPAYNSEIRIDIYSTIGTEVNDIEYSGNGSDIIITLNSLDERHSYTGLELNCKPISSCKGATDVPTLEELRTRVIRAKATANSIDTSYDLMNYMESKDSSNDYVFIKKRNDIVERRYSCYMIPRLITKDIIPSSTLDLAIVNFRDKVDTHINHYDFDRANKNSSFTGPLYYKEGLSFIGGEVDDDSDDPGVVVYTVDEDKLPTTGNINTNNFLVPLNGIYASDSFDGSYYIVDDNGKKVINPIGLTKSTIFSTLYDFLKSNDNFSDIDIPENGIISYNIIKDITFRNNITLEDVYYMTPINDNTLSNNYYYYDIENSQYINEKEKNNYNSDSIITRIGALKNHVYTKTKNDDGYYINYQDDTACYNPTLNKELFMFANDDSSNEPKLYSPFLTSDNEIIFVKTREIINIDGNQEIQNIDISSYSQTYDITLISDNNFWYITKYEDSDISKYNLMIEDTYYNSNQRGIMCYRSPYVLKISEDEDAVEVFNIRSKFDTISYRLDEIVDDNAFSQNKLIRPEIYYDGKNLDKLYYKVTKDLQDYSKDSFIPILSTNRSASNYIKSEYQYYQADLITPNIITDYKYMYLNTDNSIRKYIPYKETIKLSDMIVYKAFSILTEEGNNYSKETDDYFGYYIKYIDDDNKVTYRMESIYTRTKSVSNSDIGEYIYNDNTKLYVKDINSTSIKGIEYNTNDSGEKVSITIKAGTPFALTKEIIENSDDVNEFNDILSGDDSNHKSESYTDKYGKSIFGTINGNDVNDPKSYYQYPIQSIRNYYSEDNNYTRDGIGFYKKNTILPINRNEQIEEDKASVEKFEIDSTRGIYISDTNEKLEDYMKIYTSPYTINYDIKNQIASFFLTAINKNVSMNMIEEESDTPINFSVSSINVFRNPISEYDQNYGTYTVTVDLMMNGDMSNAKFDKDGVSYINKGFTKNSIVLKGFIYDTLGKLSGWFDFDYQGMSDNNLNVLRFIGKIEVNDRLSETYCTTMTNLYKINDLNSETTNEDVDYSYKNKVYKYINSPKTENFINLSISNLSIGIGCYILDRSYLSGDYIEVQDGDPKPIASRNDKDVTTAKCVTESISNENNQYPIFVNKCIYTLEDKDTNSVKYETRYEKYTLANVYFNTSDTLDIYTDMSNYVKSFVGINQVDKIWNNKTESYDNVIGYEVLHLTDIPVVKYSECLNYDTFSRISENIINAHESISDLSYNIVNNFSIDFKFFRTYGPCRYFKLGKTSEESDSIDKVNLGNLDISIVFSLLIKNNLSISDADVVAELKSYIKERIESLNIKDSDDSNDYTIYISNIITDIENKFNDYVRSIELVSINGYDSSYRIIYYDKPKLDDVEYYNSLSSGDVKEYLPEYINVPLNNISIKVRRS